jgi:hypothetical protein
VLQVEPRVYYFPRSGLLSSGCRYRIVQVLNLTVVIVYSLFFPLTSLDNTVRQASAMVVYRLSNAGLLSVRTASMIVYLRRPAMYILPISDIQSFSRYLERLTDYNLPL